MFSISTYGRKCSKTTKRIETNEVTRTSQWQYEAINTSLSTTLKIPTLDVQEQVDNMTHNTKASQQSVQDHLIQLYVRTV